MTCTPLPTLPGTTYHLSPVGLVADVEAGAFMQIGRLIKGKSVERGRNSQPIGMINPIEINSLEINPIEISAIQVWLSSDSLNQSGRRRYCLR